MDRNVCYGVKVSVFRNSYYFCPVSEVRRPTPWSSHISLFDKKRTSNFLCFWENKPNLWAGNYCKCERHHTSLTIKNKEDVFGLEQIQPNFDLEWQINLAPNSESNSAAKQSLLRPHFDNEWKVQSADMAFNSAPNRTFVFRKDQFAKLKSCFKVISMSMIAWEYSKLWMFVDLYVCYRLMKSYGGLCLEAFLPWNPRKNVIFALYVRNFRHWSVRLSF